MDSHDRQDSEDHIKGHTKVSSHAQETEDHKPFKSRFSLVLKDHPPLQTRTLSLGEGQHWMWVARVLKRPIEKSSAPSSSRAEPKKRDAELDRTFVTLAKHLRLVATNPEASRIGTRPVNGLIANATYCANQGCRPSQRDIHRQASGIQFAITFDCLRR